MARKMRFRFVRKSPNIGRVVAKIAVVVISLWVGGTIVNQLGLIMNCTANPFNDGLSLIGWTITDNLVPETTGLCNATSTYIPSIAGTYQNVVTNVSGSGVLAVIGIIGVASIVLEFVSFKMG